MSKSIIAVIFIILMILTIICIGFAFFCKAHGISMGVSFLVDVVLAFCTAHCIAAILEPWIRKNENEND